MGNKANDGATCYHHKKVASEVVTTIYCTPSPTGRYVTVRLYGKNTDKEILELCEVMVLGEYPGNTILLINFYYVIDLTPRFSALSLNLGLLDLGLTLNLVHIYIAFLEQI